MFVEHLANILDKKQYQRFNPYSMNDHVLKECAGALKQNFITTDKGCRNKRFRDHQKNVFDKTYVLARHANSRPKNMVVDPTNTGMYKQKWIIGNPLNAAKDAIAARFRGPEYYYLPGYLDKFSIYCVGTMCILLNMHYEGDITYAELKFKLITKVLSRKNN